MLSGTDEDAAAFDDDVSDDDDDEVWFRSSIDVYVAP